jgi:hypothetical protein
MALGRRSFLAALGFGSAAAPVALPAFGKAVAQQKMGSLAGLGKNIGEAQEGPAMDTAYDTVADVARRKLFSSPVKNVIDAALDRSFEESKKRLRSFHHHADDIYNLPSWSRAFRKYAAQREYLRREEENKTIAEKVSEATIKFWKDNGGEELEKSYLKYPIGAVGGEVNATAKSRRG